MEMRLNRSALPTTDAELKLIAALAKIGKTASTACKGTVVPTPTFAVGRSANRVTQQLLGGPAADGQQCRRTRGATGNRAALSAQPSWQSMP